jgi:signal transduction histidine kinase
MASLSKLVAGVAHELNTPLGALVASADVSDRALDRLSTAIEQGDKSKIVRALEILRSNHETSRRAGARIDERIQGLRNFARLDESEHKRADLHAGIDSTLVVLAQQLEGVTVNKRYGELPEVACSPNQLNQVFMNLLLNAARATGGKGTITITTSCDDSVVELVFEDDGMGIAPEHRARIFDPGFTRWDVGVGAGLGLSTCYQIMARHTGHVSVESELGHGSRFTLRLPRQPTPSD